MSAPPPSRLGDLSPESLSYNNGPTLLAQVSSVWAIAIVVVLARCYARVQLIKSFGTDDWIMLLAMVSKH
jgi:hypothetical protein